MPLNKEVLKGAIIKVLRDNHEVNGDSDPTGQIENSIISLADGLALAIDAFVRSGMVTTTVTTYARF